MRFRATDSRVAPLGTLIEYTDNWGFWSLPGSPRPGTTVGTYRAMYDEPHPNYTKRVADGEIILGKLQVTESRRTGGWHSATCNGTQGPIHAAGDFTTYLETNGKTAQVISGCDLYNDYSAAKAYVLTKAYSKVHQSAVNAMENAKDFSKTYQMFRRPFANARTLLDNIERRCEVLKRAKAAKYKKSFYRAGKVPKGTAVANARDAADALSQAWLEHRYGWKPIVMDAEATVDIITKLNTSKPLSRRVVSRSGLKGERTNSAQCSDSMQMYIFRLQNWTVTVTETYSVDAGVIFDINNQTTAETLAASYGLRARDIPASLWEITPYSFVADWFFNIGDWINASIPVPGVNPRGNWITGKRQRNIVITQASGSFPDPYPYGGRPQRTLMMGDSQQSWKSIIRETNVDLPTYPVHIPKPVSWTHVISGVALIAQNLAKRVIAIH